MHSSFKPLRTGEERNESIKGRVNEGNGMNDRVREQLQGMLGITVFRLLLEERTFIKTHATCGSDMHWTGMGGPKYNRAASLHVCPNKT